MRLSVRITSGLTLRTEVYSTCHITAITRLQCDVSTLSGEYARIICLRMKIQMPGAFVCVCVCVCVFVCVCVCVWLYWTLWKKFLLHTHESRKAFILMYQNQTPPTNNRRLMRMLIMNILAYSTSIEFHNLKIWRAKDTLGRCYVKTQVIEKFPFRFWLKHWRAPELNVLQGFCVFKCYTWLHPRCL
jgi:hypothetical protein